MSAETAAEPGRPAPGALRTTPPAGPGGDVPEPDKRRAEAFARLLCDHRRRITLYVMALVPDWHDAEEIVQETTIYLWEQFDDFRPGTNFAAWACKVANFRVLDARKRRGREKVRFSSEFLEAIAGRLAADPERWGERERRLAECVEKLSANHRQVLMLRYADGHSIEDVAARVGRTVSASYTLLSRIRQGLFECVTRALAREGQP